MARKRIKDNSLFSITLRFKDGLRGPATTALNILLKLFPAANIDERPREGEQEYTLIVLKIK